MTFRLSLVCVYIWVKEQCTHISTSLLVHQRYVLHNRAQCSMCYSVGVLGIFLSENQQRKQNIGLVCVFIICRTLPYPHHITRNNVHCCQRVPSNILHPLFGPPSSSPSWQWYIYVITAAAVVESRIVGKGSSE